MTSQYSFTRGLESYAYSPEKTIKRLSYPSSIKRGYLHLTLQTWSNWAPGRWVLFVHCNPPIDPFEKDDQETESAIRIAQSLGFGGLGNLYLFQKRKEIGVTEFTQEDIIQGASYWQKEAKRLFSVRIAAWGDNGTAMNHDFNVFLKMRPMLCLGKTQKGNPITTTDYNGGFDYIRLLPFYVSLLKRGSI